MALVDLREPPFLRTEDSPWKISRGILFALLPVLAGSFYVFGFSAVSVILLSVFSCFATEILWRKVQGERPIPFEAGAVVTGILLALLLPPGTPAWAVLLGGVLAISIGKMIFGGLGQNVFNPALAGFALLAVLPGFGPLMPWSVPADENLNTAFLVTGTMGGFGDISRCAILLGGMILIFRRSAPAAMPFFYLSAVALFSFASGRNPFDDVFFGNTLLFSFFYVPDATAPATFRGRAFYAFTAGSLTLVFREFAEGPAEVYALLLANGLSAFFDRCGMSAPAKAGSVK